MLRKKLNKTYSSRPDSIAFALLRLQPIILETPATYGEGERGDSDDLRSQRFDYVAV
jgi:hypothetical protein